MKKGALKKYEKKHDKNAFKGNGKLKITVLKEQLRKAKNVGDSKLIKQLQFAININKGKKR